MLIRSMGAAFVRVQPTAKKPDTFSPRTVSLPVEKYKDLVREWRLPTRAAESSAVVGPFFWYEPHDLNGKKYLRKYTIPVCHSASVRSPIRPCAQRSDRQ